MKKLFMILGVLLLLIAGGYFWFTQKTQAPSTTTQSPVSQPNIPVTTNPTTSSQINDLKAGGNSYRDPKGVYTFLYPNEYKLDTQDPIHIRIYKTGATQQGQTEMYDGSMLVFESVALGGKTIEQWIDNRIKESTADGTLEITQPKKAIVVNNHPGFTYTARGLGEATYYVIHKDAAAQNAVVITTSVQDPQGKNYQSEVDAILATLALQ